MARRLAATIGLLALAGCASNDAPTDVAPNEGPWASLTERPCPEDSYLDWESFGDPFVRSWCTGCHSSLLAEERREEAPIDVNLDSIEGVREHLERVWVRAGDQNETMPPAGGPGPEERELLGEWLACGAPTRLDLPGWE